MFSRRIPSDLSPNKLTTSLQTFSSPARQLCDLTAANPTRALLARSDTELLSQLHISDGHLYQPDPKGGLGTRKSIAAYYSRSRNLSLSPEQILCTASTSEAYAILFKVLADPGDSILIPRPAYPLFVHLLALEGLQAIHYPLRYDGIWHIDFGVLEGLIEKRTRAIVLVNPHNPTGNYLKHQELAQLSAICAKHDLALISDEVFSDYPAMEDPDRVDTVASCSSVLTFSLGGLSKTLGLPQMKLSWVIANGPDPLCTRAMERLAFVSDIFLSVGTYVQSASPQLFESLAELQDPIKKRISSNRELVRRLIQPKSGMSLLNTEGGWYQILEVPRIIDEEALVLELLNRDRVLVHPGYFFDFEEQDLLILSLLPPKDVLVEGVARLLNRISQLMSMDSM